MSAHQPVDQPTISRWKKQFRETMHPVAITGAGISVASGLPTVSAEWKGIELRDFFTVRMFVRSTAKFYQYYRHIHRHWQDARPNPGHISLAESGLSIITQNIDGLHQQAGSRHVLELHGNLRELLCLDCKAIYAADLVYQSPVPACPSCKGLLKPNIVLVGEEVYHYGTAVDWIGKADLLLIVGTRLEMAPCQELPEVAKRNGTPIIWINHDAEILLPTLVREMKKTRFTNGIPDRK